MDIVEITDLAALEHYRHHARAALEKHGGRYVLAGGAVDARPVLEGSDEDGRTLSSAERHGGQDGCRAEDSDRSGTRPSVHVALDCRVKSAVRDVLRAPLCVLGPSNWRPSSAGFFPGHVMVLSCKRR